MRAAGPPACARARARSRREGGRGAPPGVRARASSVSSGVADCLFREKPNTPPVSRINQRQSAFACKPRSRLACPPHPPLAPPAHSADPWRKRAHSVFSTKPNNVCVRTRKLPHASARTAALPRAPPSRICLMSAPLRAGNEIFHCLADTFSRASARACTHKKKRSKCTKRKFGASAPVLSSVPELAASARV